MNLVWVQTLLGAAMLKQQLVLVEKGARVVVTTHFTD